MSGRCLLRLTGMSSMLECQESEPKAGQQLFISPSNKKSHWPFYWAKHGTTKRAAGKSPDALTERLVL